jgi:hypothetical protein
VGQHYGIYGAGTCRADAIDLEPGLFEEPVQNTLGESAMGAPALKREISNPRFRHHRSGLYFGRLQTIAVQMFIRQ